MTTTTNWLSSLEDFFTHIGNRSSSISTALSELADLGKVVLPVIAAAVPASAGAIGIAEEVLTVGASVTASVGASLAPAPVPVPAPVAAPVTSGINPASGAALLT